MHPTLSELFEGQKGGLIWAGKDGQVRHTNREAQRKAGLVAAGRIIDLELSRTVASVIATRQAQTTIVHAIDLSREGGTPIRCRVVPGLAKDDALVFLEAEIGNPNDPSFDNLMHVLQHDIALPLKTARNAITASLANADEESLARPLLAPVDEIIVSVEKLVELAQVWETGSLRASDRIEPRKMIDDVWADLQDIANERGLSVQLSCNVTAEEMAPIYGSHTWLRRVFSECLESALRHARPGSVLEIEHLQMGPRVVFRFRDCGAFAPKARPAEALPAGSMGKRSVSKPMLATRDLIGFKLCQHIVEMHGGKLREETEDDLRNFLIDLPTGAPHNADTAPMDSAQMQRYAQDLAQLMARARKKPAGASVH